MLFSFRKACASSEDAVSAPLAMIWKRSCTLPPSCSTVRRSWLATCRRSSSWACRARLRATERASPATERSARSSRASSSAREQLEASSLARRSRASDTSTTGTGTTAAASFGGSAASSGALAATDSSLALGAGFNPSPCGASGAAAGCPERSTTGVCDCGSTGGGIAAECWPFSGLPATTSMSMPPTGPADGSTALVLTALLLTAWLRTICIPP
mmetsp:Transcript_46633/g.84143  ORF Transcript_46633/g.84143 Transcript_46633/m.84143 type:complete len:215 (-) Transcript_46633:2769-3413(-)